MSFLVVVYIALQIVLFEQTQYFLPMGVLVLFMFAGIIAKVMVHGRPLEVYTAVQSKYIWATIALVLAGFIAIKIVGALTALSLSVADVMFGVLAAICETWGVNAGIQTIVEFLSGSNWLGVFAGAGVAVFIHWRIYGELFWVLVYVFVAFTILNIIYKLSGDRLEVPMLAHILVNIL